jgi:hypothetical protein
MEEYGFERQNSDFANFDALAVWIKEAHRRDIKVHVWFESFYVGNRNPQDYPDSILAVKPHWMNRNKQKKASIRSLMILTLIVIGVCAAYLLINAYPEKPKLFQYILSLRIPTLIVMLIAAFSIGSASIIFQSIINNRIVTYHNQTEPLIEYYNKAGKYNEIDGVGTIEEVQERIFSVMNKF